MAGMAAMDSDSRAAQPRREAKTGMRRWSSVTVGRAQEMTPFQAGAGGVAASQGSLPRATGLLVVLRPLDPVPYPAGIDAGGGHAGERSLQPAQLGEQLLR